jgi:hypothetical protein
MVGGYFVPMDGFSMIHLLVAGRSRYVARRARAARKEQGTETAHRPAATE